MAQVTCSQPNGIALRLFEMIEGPLGIKTAREVGDTVELDEGVNEVPDEFWKKWLEANKDNEIVKLGVVRGPQEKKDAAKA